MLKKKLLSVACLSAGLGLGAASASALPYLIPTGDTPADPDYVQLLEDDFVEILIRKDESGATPVYSIVAVTPTTTIQVGDLFAGVQKIQRTELVDPDDGVGALPGETFTYIFLIETATSTCDPACGAIDGSLDTQTFKPAATADWDAIYGSGGLLDISTEFDITDLDQDGTNGPDTAVNAGTMAMMFYGANSPDVKITGANTSESATTFVKDATLQHEFGFNGGAGGADEFWRTTGTDSEFPITSPTNKPVVTIAMNVTAYWAGPELRQHVYLNGSDANFTGPTDLQAVGAVSSFPAQTPWGIKGDIDNFIRPVPTPAPLALIALGLLGLGASQRRKK